jgi:hypothetical protein
MRLILKPIGLLVTGNLRGLFSFFLVLALFGGLWETALVGLSTRATATAVMTQVGVEIINPALQHGSFGLSESGWVQLQAQAIANPTKPISIPGLKVQILGSQIAHKSFSDGTQAIYQLLAQAYYDGGAGAVFSGPSGGILPANLLPSLPLPPLSAVGLSPALLTATGHQQALNLDKWLLGAALLFLLLVALSSRRWGRLGHPAWAFIAAAVPGLIGLGVVWFLEQRVPATTSGISGLLTLLAGVFVPVYVGSAAVGVAGLVLAGVGGTITDAVRRARRRKARAPAPAWAHGPQAVPRYVPGVPTPSYGGPQDFGKSWPDSETFAPGGAGAAWGPTASFPPGRAPLAGAPRPGTPRPRDPLAPAPGYRPSGYAPDPYAPWPDAGAQAPAGGAGGWPPPPPFPRTSPADDTWPAPGRPRMPSPPMPNQPNQPGASDDDPYGALWQRRNDPPPWPPSGR